MDRMKSQAIGFGIAMALIVDVGSHDIGIAMLVGVACAAAFYVYRKRQRPS